jgi:hypothetical protein
VGIERGKSMAAPSLYDCTTADASAHGEEELVRHAVADGIRHYCAARRERIEAFVDRHFSLQGALSLHRTALGWDLVRTPFNLTMAAPAAAIHLTAKAAKRLGAARLANALSRKRLLIRTSVAHRVEWLIYTELLELPCRTDAGAATRDTLTETIVSETLTALKLEPQFHQRLARTLGEYAVTRGAASEIATSLLSLGTGAMTLGKLTPGALSFGPTLASLIAQQVAISSFPLGAGIGALWYGWFPAPPSPLLLLGLSVGLLTAGSVIAAFAGLITDPVQRLLGMHQRRLRAMIDALERQMLDPATPDYSVHDRYVARLIDVLDLTTAAYRLIR